MNTQAKVKHTPGPWFIDYDEDGNRVIVDSLDGGIIIASRVNEADAPLIAAAPELLEACQLSLKYMSDPDSSDVSGKNAIDALRNALDKAEERK